MTLHKPFSFGAPEVQTQDSQEFESGRVDLSGWASGYRVGIIDWLLGANLLTITLDLRRGTLKYSASLLVLCPSPALARSIIWERLLLGRKISQQRIQGVGGVVQCHGEEKEEATGDRAAGKKEDLGE